MSGGCTYLALAVRNWYSIFVVIMSGFVVAGVCIDRVFLLSLGQVQRDKFRPAPWGPPKEFSLVLLECVFPLVQKKLNEKWQMLKTL